MHVAEGAPTFVPTYTGYGFPPDAGEYLEDDARAHLDQITPTSPAVEFERRLLIGAPETEILTFAEDTDADLIVIGSHGRTGLARVLLGSIAEGIVRRAKCPVLTVKQSVQERHEAELTSSQ